jgi:hypothetical protein
MRALWHLLWLLVLSAMAGAQDRMAPHSKGGTIGINDLDGVTIDATIGWAGQVRWSVDNAVYPAGLKWTWRVEIGPGGTVSTFLTREVRGGGMAKTTNFSGSSVIGRPKQGSNAQSVRTDVWTYRENTLTLLRVFDRGGQIVHIKLARDASGLRCTIRGSFATEVGAGSLKTKNLFGPGHLETLSMKQTLSACRVIRG